MDLDNVHAAVEAYLPGATESEAARLRFFEGLLEIQQSHADQAASLEYTAPADDAVVERYRSGVPLFAEYPVTIDPEAFAATCGDIASYMAENAGLDQAAAQALSAYDWDSFMQKTPAKTAGSDPAAFVESALQRIDDFDVPSELPANIFMMPVVFALRAHLQPAAEQIALLYQENVPEDDYGYDHNVDCPVCGAPSTASWVGESPASSGMAGRRRMQYCGLCGTQWEFERIRCANCGSTDQNHLHYTNIEGDRAHRLLHCDECGFTQRVVFQEDLPYAPVAMEIEDAAMVKLDQLMATMPEFR